MATQAHPIASDSLGDWLDLQTIPKQYPQYTENQLRWIVHKKEINGMDEYICKVGKRVYFNIPGFIAQMRAGAL